MIGGASRMCTKQCIRAGEHAHGDEGATSAEYAIMAAAIAAVIVLVVAALGIQVSGLFQGAATALSALVGL